MKTKFKLNILPASQQELFMRLANSEWISDFYLAGGTGLALQLGHRISVDFDFFIDRDFNNLEFVKKLNYIGNFEIFGEDKNTLHGYLNGVQVSFLSYKYNILGEFIKYKNIRLADMRDIACMKLSAISARGSKKDFIDFYFLNKVYSLKELFNYYSNKYDLNNFNEYILLKSLVYFADAENEPMPVMKRKTEWTYIKKQIIKIVKDYKELI